MRTHLLNFFDISISPRFVRCFIWLMVLPFIFACGSNNQSSSNPEPLSLSLVSIQPAQEVYAGGTTIRLVTNDDCNDCQVFFGNKQIPVADFAIVAPDSYLDAMNQDVSSIRIPVIQIPDSICTEVVDSNLSQYKGLNAVATGFSTCQKSVFVKKGAQTSNVIKMVIMYQAGVHSISCGEGYHLVAGNKCIKDDLCADVSCSEGEVCTNGYCTLPEDECQNDSDCEANQECSSNGVCVKKIGSLPCDKDAQCGIGQVCISNKCAPIPTNKPIKPTYACSTTSGAKCVDGFMCVNKTCQFKGIKQDNGGYCIKDTHCKSGYCKIKKELVVGDYGNKKSGYYQDPYGTCADLEDKFNGWELSVGFSAGLMAIDQKCLGTFHDKDSDSSSICLKNAPTDKFDDCVVKFKETWSDTQKNPTLCANFEKSEKPPVAIKFCNSNKQCADAYAAKVEELKPNLPDCLDDIYFSNVATEIVHSIGQDGNSDLRYDIVNDLKADAKKASLNVVPSCEDLDKQKHDDSLNYLNAIGYSPINTNKTTHVCPAGYAVTQIKARVGAIIDQISLGCTPFETIPEKNDYVVSAKDDKGGNASAGGNGGNPHTFNVPGGSVANGFWLKACANWQAICEMDFYYVEVSKKKNGYSLNTNNAYVSNVSWGSGDANISAIIAKCPVHEVLVGIRTSSGQYVNSIQPICQDLDDLNIGKGNLEGDVILHGI